MLLNVHSLQCSHEGLMLHGIAARSIVHIHLNTASVNSSDSLFL